jgi:hypothetical protein
VGILDDIIGKKFGRLTVIERVEDKVTKNGTHLRQFLCECECPEHNRITVGGYTLTSGHTKSCGCYMRDRIKETHRAELIGKTFGRLKVIELDHITDKNHCVWKCECSCPEKNIRYVETHTLTSGHTQSCGCYKIENSKKVLTKDLTGNTFGRLTVLEKSDNYYISPGGATQVKWMCQCSCPNHPILEIVGQSLRNGVSKSCGCYRSDKIREDRFVDLTGQVFGKLTARKFVGRNEWSALWECECECGNTKTLAANHLVTKQTVSCGCLNESLVAYELKRYYKETLSAIPEYNEVRNPATNYYLPYDIYIPAYRVFIEVQGKHHYEATLFTQMAAQEHNRSVQEEFEYRQHIDKLKKEYATSHGNYIEVDLRKIKNSKSAIKYIDEQLAMI